MKRPNLFALTRSEQRVVILIVLILLTAAIVKHYRQPRVRAFPTRSTPAVEKSGTP
jgi:hypothetical protein